MDAHVVVGSTLVAGFVVFLVGAAGWRMAYEQPMVAALRVIHTDRRRRVWIHAWMVPAMFLTTAGVGALVLLLGDPAARVWALMAATVYGLGAVCWVLSLAFRLTVVPWAAATVAQDDAPPASFPALDAWAGSMYVVHMCSAYAASGLLGLGLLNDGATAAWVGWAGIGFGGLWLAGFVATRFAGPFNPPFWAHMYTGTVGTVLLLGS